MTPYYKQRYIIPLTSYVVSTEKLDHVQPLRSDRDFFLVKSLSVGATRVLESVDHEKSREKQTAEIRRINPVDSG